MISRLQIQISQKAFPFKFLSSNLLNYVNIQVLLEIYLQLLLRNKCFGFFWLAPEFSLKTDAGKLIAMVPCYLILLAPMQNWELAVSLATPWYYLKLDYLLEFSLSDNTVMIIRDYAPKFFKFINRGTTAWKCSWEREFKP